MANNKKYWKGLEDLENNPEFIKKNMNEFAEPIPMDEFLSNGSAETSSTPRRDFLKYLGFSVTAASLAACDTPVRKVIPYLIKPEEITPGIANYYASTYFDGNDFASILVKTREGRPIKIEANTNAASKQTGTTARVQASVLSLYDSQRLRGALGVGKKEISWEAADKEIGAKLAAIAAKGGNIRIVTATIISPSTKQIIADFITKYPTAKHVQYDAISYSAITKANDSCFKKAVVPTYKFENAYSIVSVGADFIGTWVDACSFAAGYAANRKLGKSKKMSRHIQFEANMSLSGANADYRFKLKPSQYGTAILNLHNAIAKLAGGTALTSKATEVDKEITAAAKHLWDNKGKALVVCGLNDVSAQTVTNAINVMLGSYGSTIDIDNNSNLHQGSDSDFADLVAEMNAGKVDAIIMNNVNPVYSAPGSLNFAGGLAKVGLKISTADRVEETADLCDYVLPDSNFLESWGDASPAKGMYTLQQPAINKLWKTRQFQDTLLMWTGSTDDYYTYLTKYWENNTFKMQTTEASFTAFWNKSLHNGVFEMPMEAASTLSCGPQCGDACNNAAAELAKVTGGEWEMVAYEKVGIGNGSLSNNPWLQEMPDPVTKVCWDNYALMSPEQMKKMGFNTYNDQEAKMDVVEITANGKSVKLPVFPQPGQKENTIAIALGYGRTKSGKVGDNVGQNIYPFLKTSNGTIQYIITDVKIGDSIDKTAVASTQMHGTMMGREIIKETTFSEYLKDPKAGNPDLTFAVKNGHEETRKTATELDLWATPKAPGHDRPNHFWNMAIDLNSCVGCGACVVACNVENNIAVVGKDEIRRSREMHWLRIDRYYSSDNTKGTAEASGKGIVDAYLDMEIPSESPQVVFQPVMCQHCNHAPCETVCPVLATTHSSEGLNQMTYNRCVGTRYCANNCPYKVRRFNFFRYTENAAFDYTMYGEVERMVLNPDVTVRSRGVIEKCSMCVQRIQEGKLKAKKESRRPIDGEVRTACQQACSTGAIIFGDANDEMSKVAEAKKDDRKYFLLEELNVQPSVFYLTKVRNADELKGKDEKVAVAQAEEKKEEAKAE